MKDETSIAADRPVTHRGRILVSKLGLDGHDVGAHVVASGLRDAGFEVIYLGIRQRPEAVAATAVDEDVDVVGISILSGAQRPLIGRLADLLGSLAEPPALVVGGLVPDVDRAHLTAIGVAAIFDATESMADIVAGIDAIVAERRR